MNDQRPVLMVLSVIVILSAAHPWQACRADSSDDTNDDGTKKTYYWQGNQINNLGRLGSSANFEEEQRRAHEGQDANQYLTRIREQMAHQAQQEAQKKTLLTFQGQLAGNPIELTSLSPGVRVTLHADVLFDENSATMKAGAIDTLDRLRTILQTQEQKPLEFVIADKMDDSSQSKNVDADRSLVVLSLLQLPEKDASQDELTPPPLSR